LGQICNTVGALGALAQAVNKSSVVTDKAMDFILVCLSLLDHLRLQRLFLLAGLGGFLGLRCRNR
jgi:hypothetical protein